jgi:hypothetical protein
MIRVLAILLGLALGLGAALVVFGRMAHLRAAIDLPPWTDAVTADAGLLRGQADLPLGFTLDWRLARIGLSGPVWTGAIHRPDARLDLTARLRRLPETGLHLALRVDPGTATLAGGRLAGHFPAVLGTGFVVPDGLWLDLDAAGQRLRLDDQDLPDGPVNLNLWPRGWRLALGGSGTASPGRSETGTDLRDLFGE